MRRLPALSALAVAAAGCVAASACTWEPGGPSACDDFIPTQKNVNALGSWACTIAEEAHVTSASSSSTVLKGEMCDKVCGPGFGNCQLPDAYIQAYLAAQAGAPAEASSDAADDGPGLAADSGDANRGAPAADAGAAPACPSALDSQEFVVLCTSSC